MKLYFNGCSNTFGDELDHPELEAYPTLIAQHYQADFKNDAIQGGSNDRIWFRTIQHIDQFDKFYIQWTHPSRFTLYDPSNQWEIAFTPHLRNTDYKNKDHFKTFGMYYYSFWDNAYQNYIKLLSYIISLQSLFEKHRKEYWMYWLTKDHLEPFPMGFQMIPKDLFSHKLEPYLEVRNLSDENIDNMYSTIENLLSLIDRNRFIEQGYWNPIDKLRSYPDHKERFIAKKDHGNATVHRYLADSIIDFERKTL